MEKIPKSTFSWYILFLCLFFSLPTFAQRGDTVVAEIAAIGQPVHYNRMGTIDQNGMMYALKSDLINSITGSLVDTAGVMLLNPSKRPRPLVIRANKGNVIKVILTNWVYNPTNSPWVPIQVGFSANGMKYIDIGNNNHVSSDGSFVGANEDNQVSVNETKTYYLRAEEEGSFLIRDAANGRSSENGLFGSITVHPENAEWYCSQVTEEELEAATLYYVDPTGKNIGKPTYTGSVPPGFPVVNYDALKMYQEVGSNTRILTHTDLTAIITGENAGRFKNPPGPLFDPIPASPDRRQPYREFSITYHNNNTKPLNKGGITNAFDLGSTTGMSGAALSGQDQFSINYANAGITNEIYSNRIQKGPAADCVECAYEEFFLSSWVLGDPSMRVDVPVNISDTSKAGLKATVALYPDDPSNVYHSYMNDHVKFRINHASIGIPHVHHQHAHQWLHSPNSPNGHYMDSQTIIPGSSWTLEMVYNGSGNRNKTVGDNIFHCHFYPHFAGGMWGLWRVHDVLEVGTKLDGNGIPVSGSRALPDAEIMAGTPIPGLVPLPTIAMPSIPGKVHIKDGQAIVDISNNEVNPGFPFFIPGIAGKRAPHPPMDFAVQDGDTLDGGLPRHLITDGAIVWQQENQYDWTKITDSLSAIRLPEAGTPVEQLAMRTHAKRKHPSFKQHHTNQGTPIILPESFILNGLAPASGAPFAAPYIGDNGDSIGRRKLIYKAADIQMDVVLNKVGWHYPQQRLITLWGDIATTLDGTRPPEPFFFRANTNDFIEFWQTNLVPDYYESDDFQVRTPTDIIGQHIHLVKFDVTSSDGAANGWNYEDGTFSPDAVRERIHGIKSSNKYNWYKYNKYKPVGSSIGTAIDTSFLQATPPRDEWGPVPQGQDWHGAQTTVQLWYADSLLNLKNEDRTVRTVFTHDHFGPSTHQQVGLYAGLLVEPEGSTWEDPITGTPMYDQDNRTDGGPTSFQANILTGENDDDSYREFALEFQDMQLAYKAGSKALVTYPEDPDSTNITSYTGYRDPTNAINPPANPQIVSSGQSGTFSINYRNEPLFLRVSEESGDSLLQAEGQPGDLAYSFQSRTDRAIPAFNTQPAGPPLTPGMQPGDPFTPLLRAYEGDNVQIRTLVGAHEVPHVFNLHGLPWLFEPSNKNSGYRSTQVMGISEHFEMLFQLPNGTGNVTDYLYNASNDHSGNTAGLWGMIRAYDHIQANGEDTTLVPLPNNPVSDAIPTNCGCPHDAPLKSFFVSAVSISDVAPNGRIDYNKAMEVYDSLAMIFVEDKDLIGGKLRPGKKIEPLILRANAGDCIAIQLTNKLKPDPKHKTTFGYSNSKSTTTHVTVSTAVGLHAQLLSYDASKNDGFNVGLNEVQTINPGDPSVVYNWYAGVLEDGELKDAETGTVLLTSADPIEQYARGLFGAIIIEPKTAKWITDVNSNAAATVLPDSLNSDSTFREFVVFLQDNLVLTGASKGNTAINYKQEYLTARGAKFFQTSGTTKAFSNKLVNREPETPIFAVEAGTPVRIRLLQPGGTGSLETFILGGHGWQEEPYRDNSKTLGNNTESQYLGSRSQLGPTNNFDLLIDAAGGEDAEGSPGAFGDYLYRTYQLQPSGNGAWGLMRVMRGPSTSTIANIDAADSTKATIIGSSTVDVNNGLFPKKVTMYVSYSNSKAEKIYTTSIDPLDGSWTFSNVNIKDNNGLAVTNYRSLIDQLYTSDRLEALEIEPTILTRKRLVPKKLLLKKQAEDAADEAADRLKTVRKQTRKISSKQK